ncbi:hypothetical protein FJY68_05665 [candidate division WOR-3 bacterium]|uniref:Uncharacterized protein n=1 Tax=candidate division WOR-3 bacterium TaxID=2052148 RepID=A0A937XE28_UNCW3|nr:hypothetical protein [candidate division WOR-3 bacterium]
MRRLLLIAALLVGSVVIMASRCAGGHGTKIFIANWTQYPFHPNGGDRLDLGCSRDVLTLKHGTTEEIAIKRNGVTVVTVIVKSLVAEASPNDYEAGIRLEEPNTVGQFAVSCDAADIVLATLRHPSP